MTNPNLISTLKLILDNAKEVGRANANQISMLESLISELK